MDNRRIKIVLATAAICVLGYILWKYFRPQNALEKQVSPNVELIENPKPCLALYFTNWCPHCSNMQNAWKEVEKNLKEEGAVDVINIEQTTSPAEFEKAKNTLQNFAGVPDIRLFPKGMKHMEECIKYEGGDRSTQSIMAFVYSNLGQ